MTRKSLTLFVIITPLIALPLLALLASGCGIFTYPFSAAKAGIDNLQNIKLNIALLDDSGQPLDDVMVVVTRWTEDPHFYLLSSGTSPTPGRPEHLRFASKVFTYESHGNCAIRIDFSKPGYLPATAVYAHATELATTGTWYATQPHECIDVTHAPNQSITLRKEPTTQP